jgi:hypothetical protein
MYGKTGIEIHEIEDVYKTLFISIFFDTKEEFENFELNLFFDIQMSLEGGYVFNVYTEQWKDHERDVVRLKTYINLLDAIAMLETLIEDPRYVLKAMYKEVKNVRGQIEVEEDEFIDTIDLDGADVAKLRTYRNRLLELSSYS